jgi:hypothetical protein
MTIEPPTELKTRLKAPGLFGLIACCDEIIDKPWLRDVLAFEERERLRGQETGADRRRSARTRHRPTYCCGYQDSSSVTPTYLPGCGVNTTRI